MPTVTRAQMERSVTAPTIAWPGCERPGEPTRPQPMRSQDCRLARPTWHTLGGRSYATKTTATLRDMISRASLCEGVGLARSSKPSTSGRGVAAVMWARSANIVERRRADQVVAASGRSRIFLS
jgi:hypothetical protein